MSETILIGTLLALAGGFLDAYTYICRGGVFANAQTGNIVLFSIHLTQMEWARAAASAIPVIAFALGIIVTETVRRRQKLIGFLHWRQGMLILEIVILAAAVYIAAVALVFRGLIGNVRPKSLYVGMISYLIINGTMNCFALFQLVTLPCFATAIMYAGAISFFVSDSILFYVRFRKGRPFKTHFGVMLTYLLAEFLIVSGFILLAA